MRGLLVLLLLLGACQAVFREDYVKLAPDGSQLPGGDGPGSSTGSGTTGARIVFVTHATFAGDLTGGTAGGDGLAGADSLCQGEANAVPLPGQYRAWLSTTSTAAVARITHTGGPFVLPDAAHTMVAKDWGAFAFSISGGGPHLHAIDERADGSPISSNGCDVWTNTLSDGTPASSNVADDCYEWTTVDQGYGHPLGSVDQLDARWTADFTCLALACTMTARLYCVQQ